MYLCLVWFPQLQSLWRSTWWKEVRTPIRRAAFPSCSRISSVPTQLSTSRTFKCFLPTVLHLASGEFLKIVLSWKENFVVIIMTNMSLLHKINHSLSLYHPPLLSPMSFLKPCSPFPVWHFNTLSTSLFQLEYFPLGSEDTAREIGSTFRDWKVIFCSLYFFHFAQISLYLDDNSL